MLYCFAPKTGLSAVSFLPTALLASLPCAGKTASFAALCTKNSTTFHSYFEREIVLNGVSGIENYESIDDLQLCGLKLLQDMRGFRFGIDAVLLADFAKHAVSSATLDLCSGNGIVAILLAGKTDTPKIQALEIQHDAAALAQRSIALNGLQERVNMVCADVRDALQIFGRGSFNVITCNPPYLPCGKGLQNAASAKTLARHEVACTLEDILQVSYGLLRPGGRLFMVHRPQRLVDILSLMRRYHLEPKRMRMVHPAPHKAANIVLVEGAYQGGHELRLMPPLYVYDENGCYSREIDEIYGRTGESNE